MRLNNIGEIANKFWLEIPQHFNNVILDEYVIMPNHTHGIIMICNDWGGNVAGNVDGAERQHHKDNNYTSEFPQMSKISPKSKSLPVIIGSFKSICTKTINRQYPNLNFAWQPRFHDIIIFYQ